MTQAGDSLKQRTLAWRAAITWVAKDVGHTGRRAPPFDVGDEVGERDRSLRS